MERGENIRVKVYLPSFCELDGLDKNLFIELEEGTTLETLLKCIQAPENLKESLHCVVNYKKEEVFKVLKDGDIITFFMPMAGG